MDRKTNGMTSVSPGGRVRPLVGRQGHMARLEQALDAVGRGDGATIHIQGDAGIGKTALLRYAVARARERDLRVGQASGSRSRSARPLGVIGALLRPLVEDRTELFTGAAALARPAFEAAGAGEPGAVVQGLLALVDDLAAERALVLAVDDARLADTASLEVLTELTPLTSELPLLLLVAMRPRESSSGSLRDLRAAAGVSRMTLEPLKAVATSELVRERLPRAVDSFCERCYSLTRGNAFYVEQLLFELERAGIEGAEDDLGALDEIEASPVRAMIVARLEALSPVGVEVGRAAAALGDDATEARIAAIASLSIEQTRETAARLAVAGILSLTETFGFAHPISHRAVYTSIPEHTRAELHDRIAQILRDEGAEPERAAAHILLTEPRDSPEVVHALRSAAAEAISRGAPALAARYLRRALNEPARAPARAEVLAELGRALAAEANPEALDRLTEAAEETDDPVAEARIVAEAADVLAAAGRRAEAAAALRGALDILRDADPPLRRELIARYVSAGRLLEGHQEECAVLFKGILEQRSEVTPGERTLFAWVSMETALSVLDRDEALRLAERAWEDGHLLAQETSVGPAHQMVAAVYRWADELERSIAICDAAAEDARRRASLLGYAGASYNRAFPLYWRGAIGASLAATQQALEAVPRGWAMFELSARCQHARSLIEWGDLERAEQSLQVDDARWSEDLQRSALCEVRGLLRLAQGRPHDAIPELRATGEMLSGFMIENPAFLAWRPALIDALALAGQPDEAAEVLETAMPFARRWGSKRELGMLLRAGATASAGDAALAMAQEAVEILEGSESRLELLRAQKDLGRILHRQREAKAARSILRQVVEEATETGARALAEQGLSDLVAAGGRPRRLETRGRGSLTPIQTQIAGLAAEGLTNEQIASDMFLSRRSVEWHLGRIYKKLAISSRTELPIAFGR